MCLLQVVNCQWHHPSLVGIVICDAFHSLDPLWANVQKAQAFLRGARAVELSSYAPLRTVFVDLSTFLGTVPEVKRIRDRMGAHKYLPFAVVQREGVSTSYLYHYTGSSLSDEGTSRLA